MRKIAVVTGLVVGICILSAANAGGDKEAKEEPARHEASDLSAVVAKLTTKVTALEKRIEILEANRRPTVLGPRILQRLRVVPEVSQRGETYEMPYSAVPDNWQRHEYHGLPYYIVPLAEEQSKR